MTAKAHRSFPCFEDAPHNDFSPQPSSISGLFRHVPGQSESKTSPPNSPLIRLPSHPQAPAISPAFIWSPSLPRKRSTCAHGGILLAVHPLLGISHLSASPSFFFRVFRGPTPTPWSVPSQAKSPLFPGYSASFPAVLAQKIVHPIPPPSHPGLHAAQGRGPMGPGSTSARPVISAPFCGHSSV